MENPAANLPAGIAPTAVVWCRQVDNEAESPGYTTIPEEFPGRRETLETIRLVGNLTINVADTHDYWDPDPAQPLSYYPNLFLYPAANGRYTCVGRMFLSTEDRPRLGMKTLVFPTVELVASGEFGAAVLRAHATMGGRSGPVRPTAEPDGSVYQAVGEGFLFHRGSTEPTVIVAAEQWEAASEVVLDLVRLLPSALVALSAFLVFPYFLPEAKVNLHEFTEQLPLALAVMRVPKGEASGDRHTKRLQSWQAAPVGLRDLTRPSASRARENLPLVLQYARDHLEQKIVEVARRVDLVEGSRTRGHLHDPDHQGGRDRRKEMWRIGTAMETAALLLARPKGRTVPMTGDAAKRANEYLRAEPPTSPSVVPEPLPVAAPSPAGSQLPPWLRSPTEITVPPPGPVAVPVSVSDDPSAHVAPPPVAPPPATTAPFASAPSPFPTVLRPSAAAIPAAVLPPPPSAPATAPFVPFRPGPAEPERARSLARPVAASADTGEVEARLLATVDRRLRDSADQTARGLLELRADLSSRLAAVEGRPSVNPADVIGAAERKAREAVDARLNETEERTKQSVQSAGERWAARLREELHQGVEELKAQSLRAEEELRAALVTQLDLELAESREQGNALREGIEERVRDLLKDRTTEADQRRTKELRDVEQRVAILVDGRTRDLENRIKATVAEQEARLLALSDERAVQAEQRSATEREARVSELSEAQTQALAGLQVRMQAYFEQKLRENQEREREKYVELLARLKVEVDQSLAKSIDSAQFESAVRDRVAQVLERARVDQEKVVAAGLADTELRLRQHQEEAVNRVERIEAKLQQRETDLARIERNVRHEADDLDRRLQVLSDRMMPIVRKTWLKVAELEKGGGSPEEGANRVGELRRELTRELRRVEGELLEQTGELRDRLEGTIAHQGRIWLNLLRQMSPDSGDGRDPATRPARRGAHPTEELTDEEFLSTDLRAAAGYPGFDDPPNPLSPHVDTEVDPPARRRARRT